MRIEECREAPVAVPVRPTPRSPRTPSPAAGSARWQSQQRGEARSCDARGAVRRQTRGVGAREKERTSSAVGKAKRGRGASSSVECQASRKSHHVAWFLIERTRKYSRSGR